MQRGIRQGCPVSALLFIFVLEISASKIRNDEEIKGLSFQNMNNSMKRVQHADDCTNLFRDAKSLKKII